MADRGSKRGQHAGPATGPSIGKDWSMDRIVRQIHPEERPREAAAVRRLSELLTQPNIVLLGDPGAGKSHTFRELAAASGGRYLTARAFLTLPVRNRGEVLFIDG